MFERIYNYTKNFMSLGIVFIEFMLIASMNFIGVCYEYFKYGNFFMNPLYPASIFPVILLILACCIIFVMTCGMIYNFIYNIKYNKSNISDNICVIFQIILLVCSIHMTNKLYYMHNLIVYFKEAYNYESTEIAVKVLNYYIEKRLNHIRVEKERMIENEATKLFNERCNKE